MTLNGHFALKSGSSSTSNGLAFLVFGENCLKICRATHDCVIHWCSPKRKCQTSELCSHSQFSDMLFTDMEISKITMLELGSRQNMTGMETERARGKCIANALVCQLC